MNKIDELVMLCKKDSNRAKEELILRLRPLILASIKRYYYGDLDFEELVQEGNLKVLSAIDKFDFLRGVPFLGYVKTILKYRYLELSRKKTELLTLNMITEEGIEIVDTLPDNSEIIDKIIINLEIHENLKEALLSLTEKQRKVIELIYFRNFNMIETAKILGVHYQTVVALKKRAFERMKKILRSMDLKNI